MKYIAIVDDELLSNFRVDIKSNAQFCSDMILVVTDKAGFTRGIRLKPLEQESTTRNCFGCKYSTDNHNSGTEECHLCMWENQYTPIIENNLGLDCISRADAIKAMQNKAKKLKNEDTINGLCGAVAILYEMPSVTPQESRKGHWIADVDRWGDLVTTVNGYKCSECGGFNTDKDNYCPNCGAKMESENV